MSVWSANAHNHIILMGLVGLAVYMWGFADVGPAGLFVGMLALLVAVFFCWVRVVLTDTTVEIAFGPWRWPKKVVALSDVADASTETVQPLRYGGWGYRLCGVGCRAIIVRRGEALKLKMKDEKVLIVTVDRAEEAARLINELKSTDARG